MEPRPPVQYTGVTFNHVRLYVKKTSLRVHLVYFTNDITVVDVERHFRRFIRGIDFWEIDRSQELFTTLCMLLLIKEVNLDIFCHKRCNLMVRFMQFVDCVTPMSAHMLMEHLLNNFAEQQLDSDGNILQLSNMISDLGFAGRVFGVCLLWSLLSRHLPALEVTMNRFREPNELAEAIRKTPPIVANISTENAAEIGKLCLIFDAMDRVLTMVLIKNNDDLVVAGYPTHFFVMDAVNVNFLLQWCLDIGKKVPKSMVDPNTKFGKFLQNIIGLLIKYCNDAAAKAKELKPEAQVEVEVDVAMSSSDAE